MELPTVKSLVKNDQEAEFQYCYDGSLWYKIQDLEFPVPLSEVKGGKFSRTHRAISLMRWIRKHLDSIREAKKAAKESAG